MKTLLSLLILVTIILVLILVVSELPPFGNPDNPANNEVANRYLSKAVEETGATNVVTAIITDYRALDTLGEVTVLLAAIAGLLAVLRA